MLSVSLTRENALVQVGVLINAIHVFKSDRGNAFASDYLPKTLTNVFSIFEHLVFKNLDMFLVNNFLLPNLHLGFFKLVLVMTSCLVQNTLAWL